MEKSGAKTRCREKVRNAGRERKMQRGRRGRTKERERERETERWSARAREREKDEERSIEEEVRGYIPKKRVVVRSYVKGRR